MQSLKLPHAPTVFRVTAVFLGLLLAGSVWAGQPVNINAADAKTLAASLDDIGTTKAEAIVAYRAAHGPFTAAAQLSQVKGIGEKTIAKNTAFIKLK